MLEQTPSSRLRFPDLTIQGFRGFKNLSIPRLGRVTLITGKNNTGKSSILEALRIHTHNGAPYLIEEILTSREEYSRNRDGNESSSDSDNLLQLSALFNGFPQHSEEFGTIAISTSDSCGKPPMKLVLKVGWFTEREDADGYPRLVARHDALPLDAVDIAAMVIETEEKKQTLPLQRLFRYSRIRRMSSVGQSGIIRMPCILTNPYSGEGTSELEHLWAGIALTDNEVEIVDALKIIDPRISAVSMVVRDASFGHQIAIVRSDNFPQPVPLRSFGDGLNRLFTIVLSLINARGGLLLVDEFENGLHYSVQLDLWRIIFRLSKALDVQVFVTSHSWDTIEALQQAASEVPEEAALVHLSVRGNDVIPTVFTEDELAIVTRDKIEVR